MTRRTLLASAVLLAILLAIYAPDIGHGFLRDDFRWIREGRVETVADVAGLFRTNVGFYRPLVSLSFAGDYALHELEPFGYGLTNLALLLGGAGLLFVLVRTLGLPAAAALAAAGVFVLNFHGVNMALLWLSGRTSLLALVFALAAMVVLLRGYGLAAGALCLVAMLAKEEVLALPAIATAFLWLTGGRPVAAWPMWAGLLVYIVLRSGSGAFTPATAPDYYQFSFAPAALLRNVGEYADRAATLAAAVSVVLLAVSGRVRPGFTGVERRALMLAALWVPAMFALTVALPLRSSLYALIPSVGCALVVAVCASRAARLQPHRFAVAAAALIVLAAALVPIYRARNVRWLAPADLSRHVMESIRATTTSFPAGGRVVLVDAPEAAVGLDEAFDQMFSEALALYAGDMWVGQVVKPGEPLPTDERTTIAYELRDGTLEPLSIRRR